MDISKCLDQLRKELEHLDAAILSLERLQQRGLRRDRILKNPSELDRSKPVLRGPGRQRKQIRRDPTE